MQTEKTEMQEFSDFTIEHFPDRNSRWLFQYKQNVQGLLEIAAAASPHLFFVIDTASVSGKRT